MINPGIIMDDLLQSGNIVTEDSRLEEMGCHPYGYFRYIQGYTFVRKYGTLMRYYVDIESYLYKEPVSKAKKPDVLVQNGDKLRPGAEYYMRICGVNKKQTPPALYRAGSMETSMLVNSALFQTLEKLSWQNKPQVNPIRLMSTNNALATQPGDYYLYRTPYWLDDDACGFPSWVNVGIWPVPMLFSLEDFQGHSFVTTEEFAHQCTADVIYHEGIRCDWENDSGEKPGRRYFYTNFIFNLKAVRQMLEIDPDLVFAPVYTTGRDMQELRKEALAFNESTYWDEGKKARLYKLRDYCRQWGHVYDSERFDREYPRFW